jgi:uncharacterized membrane protein YozB (DUF420 family)
MLRIIIPHLSFGDRIGFLLEKQAYIHNPVWRTAFYIHVFSSILTLIAGGTQFSSYLLKHHRKLHRFMGRIYVWDILFINFPAGMVLAVHANGAWHTGLAFAILDCLWFWFTLRAFEEIGKKNIEGHRRHMIRSYALTLSAITLRSWKMILSFSTPLDAGTIYMMDAWLGFVPNWLAAEWFIARYYPVLSARKIDIDRDKIDNDI